MRPKSFYFVAATLLLLGVAGCGSRQEKAQPQMTERVVAPGSVEDTVSITNLKSTDALIEGTLVNSSSSAVNDVYLLINHSFLWKNERNPGRDNPSRTEYYKVAKPIPPSGAMRFEYRPSPPLPKRGDGKFVTTVEVVSFAEIGEIEAGR
jgi:hypothetical protein